jgi:serine/threonine-protein phosphatase PP1 catalytic subunit
MDKQQGDSEVNKVIEKLLAVRGLKVQKSVNLTETEIKNLLAKSIEVFMAQPIVLELEAPIKVVR